MPSVSFITFDLETTDKDPTTCWPVSLTARVCNNELKHVETVSYYINVPEPSKPGAFEVHKLTQEFLQKAGLPCLQAANKWRSLIWKYAPVVILGYNCINFDMPVIMRFCKKYAKSEAFPWPPVFAVADVMFLAQWQFQMKGWPKLKETVDRLGIPSNPDDFHKAGYDVEMTWKCFVKLTEKWRI